MTGIAAIGLNNPKIEANLGGVLRAAHCYGASMVGLRGERYKRQYTDTTKAYRHTRFCRPLIVFLIFVHSIAFRLQLNSSMV
jgi:tRNA(Leu) C34 or U34 (ribose-2'-O)-methylase TrmL